MRSRNSESFIVLPLLPIFLLGAFPMLLLSLMGPAGLVILGILIASVGLTDVLESNSAYSEQIIVHGYTRGTERAIQHQSAIGNPLCRHHDRRGRRTCRRGALRRLLLRLIAIAISPRAQPNAARRIRPDRPDFLSRDPDRS
jgi:hypothetical protein